MRCRKLLNFIPTALSIGIAILFLTSGIYAQSENRERPKIKDFGSSLKRKKEKDSMPAKQGNSNGEDVIKVNTDLVTSDILVLDEKGVAVKDLTKDDFIVTENGQQQEIQFFALGDDAKVPRSIVLLIDYSESEIPFIVSSVMSAKVLVDSLKPNDQMAIVTDNVELLCGFTNNKELLKKQLESLKLRVLTHKYGDSRQYSALDATVKELFNAEDIRRIVIFQTDGDQINLKNKKFDFPETVTDVEKSRAIIYSIFPGLRYENLTEREKYLQAEREQNEIAERFMNKVNFDLSTKHHASRDDLIKYYENTTKQQQVLEQISKTSGGWLEYLQTPMQANDIYSKILEDMSKRYVIGYYPKEDKTGKRKTVKIEIKNHPEYQIEGRKTYYGREGEN